MSEIPFAMQKTEAEVQAMSPTELRAYEDMQRKVVFGHDSKVDRDGNPIEQGIGSPAQPSRNSIEAYKRWHKDDPDFKETLARMEAEYAEYIAAKKAAPKRKVP